MNRPRNEEIMKVWKDALKRLGLESCGHRPVVCKLHFDPREIECKGKKWTVKSNAVPSIRGVDLLDELLMRFVLLYI